MNYITLESDITNMKNGKIHNTKKNKKTSNYFNIYSFPK